MRKATIVLGANNNPERYAYKAVEFLQSIQQPIYPVGIKSGEVRGLEILHDFKDPKINEPIDTVTLYLNPFHQEMWYQQIINLKPKRVIFNPGTENDEFEDRLRQEGIEVIEACTLVMIRTGVY